MKSLGNKRQVTLEGNTELLKSKQQTRKTFYCFTAYNYKEVEIELNRQLQQICKKYLYGYEICPTTGKPHLQGFLALKKPMRITELNIVGKPHFEACIADEESNIKYCSKTASSDPTQDGKIVKYGFPIPIKTIENLYEWQKTIETLYFSEPDDRAVNWYWEGAGKVGKSAFVKYMVLKHGCLFCDGGKKADLINLVFNSNMDKCRAIIWDLPRSTKGKISYSTLESIKNGLICNTKYETGVKVFNPPHIFVFANFPPDDENELSKDRWNIVKLQ